MDNPPQDDDLAWNDANIATHECTITAAVATPDEVVLSFGARVADERQPLAFSPRLLRTIALRPASAKHLRDMLARAISSAAPLRPTR